MNADPPDLPSLKRALTQQTRWDDLDPAWLEAMVRAAREEDLTGEGFRKKPRTPGDATSGLLRADLRGEARLVAREAGVMAGGGLVPLILRAYGIEEAPEMVVRGGDAFAAGDSLVRLKGSAQRLLQAERPMLNFIQKLCGIATLTRAYVEALAGSDTTLLDTRKTTPGWRALEKYAVACGGGTNHRRGLYDRIMLKDNHLAATGESAGDRLAAVVRRAREERPDLVVEVEIDALDQLAPVLRAGAQVVLLDNFNDTDLEQAVGQARGRALTEVSGGVTRERLPRIAKTGADFVSTGATVHQAQWLDIGLDWEGAQ